VLAERASGALASARVRHVWHRAGDWPRELVETIELLQPDLVHVQHRDALFGHDYRLPMVLFALRARGIRTVVTLHEIAGSYGHRVFHRKLALHGDRLVVHERDAVLVAHGVPAAQVVHVERAASAADHAALYRKLALRAAA